MAAEGSILPHVGRLLVLLPGLGAVTTTFLAGVEAVRRKLAYPFGSLSQLGELEGMDGHGQVLRNALPLAPLEDLVFATWDIFPDDAYEAARQAKVLSEQDLAAVEDFLRSICPMPAVFDPQYVRRLNGPHVKRAPTKRHLAEALCEDIHKALQETGASRAVLIWCASTEVYIPPAPCHHSLKAFEAALEANDPAIPPSQIYAYAALRMGIPYANGAPNVSADIPALEELAELNQVPIAGKDFKTGQTLLKTVIAPALRRRLLGVQGWFSVNILGNRDGWVLEDEGSFRAKEVTKTGVLEGLLPAEQYPELYGELYHKVRIHYYPPRGDAKESWDAIDIVGWMGYPMHIKINFQCRDSILAAPVVLDVALFLDLAHRAGWHGVQSWLGFYFKSPHVRREESVEHDLFVQYGRLQQALTNLARLPAKLTVSEST
ncbi:MAG: inositol-3-phosphate synthase [Candidatus Kapabacteria bacterium]|nr:inositol-3-phosphate synthase [Candidatus Kapabacteria bacterium]MCS7169622.1 inositol-3-phosphate synthase [Candidatus Kapabacteria bacterium]MDW7997059.1 inositol-3-phosphate synthase [Bacteroidota bacterium]MDW8225038.1 inositol-3-phosphate synthase [Bacteroidota bacterium]